METLPKEKEHLVIENMNLVHYVLQRQFHMNPYQTDYDDYYQEGCIGLILSAIRFDELKGFKFSTYACPMIRGNIMRYRRDRANAVKIPRDKYNLLMTIINLSSQGYSFHDIEIMTGYSEEDIQYAMNLSMMDSLDRTIIDDSNKDVTLAEIASNHKNDYEEALAEEHIFECIPKVTEMLSSKMYKDIWEEYIWSLYYGEKLNQMYFSAKYKVSQAQVSRILRGCKKLFIKVLNM